jgi:hypothetical protein
MLPCIKERPDGDLEEMHQDRPARDANEHPRRRPEAPLNRCRPPLHQLKAAVRPIAWIVTQSAIRHQAMKSFESIDDPIFSPLLSNVSIIATRALLENWPLVQDRTVLSCNGYCLRVVFETDRWD